MKNKLLLTILIPLSGCSYFSSNTFNVKEPSKVQYVRTDTDKRDIQIDYVGSQASEVRLLINKNKWLSSSTKEKVSSDITLALSNLNSVATDYHKVCAGNEQSYYESYNYFIDQYLGSIMRYEDLITKSLNEVNTENKSIKKQSGCRSEKSCAAALNNSFLNVYMASSTRLLDDINGNLKLIKSLNEIQSAN